jgi:hypothetical protein
LNCRLLLLATIQNSRARAGKRNLRGFGIGL